MTREVDGAGGADRWRLFVALPVPASAARAIHEALTPHREAHPQARWLAPELYHVTLRFLGAVDTVLVPDLAQAVRRCAEDRAGFSVTVGRGGGARGRSEVAWLDVLAGRDEVTGTADRLDALLPREVAATLRATRPAPHLTIARRAPASLARGLREESVGVIRVTWTAARMVLFRSHTGTPVGSSYETLVEARLAA